MLRNSNKLMNTMDWRLRHLTKAMTSSLALPVKSVGTIEHSYTKVEVGIQSKSRLVSWMGPYKNGIPERHLTNSVPKTQASKKTHLDKDFGLARPKWTKVHLRFTFIKSKSFYKFIISGLALLFLITDRVTC